MAVWIKRTHAVRNFTWLCLVKFLTPLNPKYQFSKLYYTTTTTTTTNRRGKKH